MRHCRKPPATRCPAPTPFPSLAALLALRPGRAGAVVLLQRRPAASRPRCSSASSAPIATPAGATRPRARSRRGELALDWIVPGARGDDAPLAAAASRDALERLRRRWAARGPCRPTRCVAARQPRGRGSLRVAHGAAVQRLHRHLDRAARGAGGGPWTAWLRAGGDAAGRHRRHAGRAQPGAQPAAAATGRAGPRPRAVESRPMAIPEGAQPGPAAAWWAGWRMHAARIRAIAAIAMRAAGGAAVESVHRAQAFAARFFCALLARRSRAASPSAHSFFNDSFQELGHGNLRLRQRPAAAAQVPRGKPLRMRRQRRAGRPQLPHPGGAGQHEDGGGRDASASGWRRTATST